jgi:hypothetical protein
MTLWRLVFVCGSASLLAACGPDVYMLVPNGANAGQLHHDCHLEWPWAGKPSGTCKESTGDSFAVRFE